MDPKRNQRILGIAVIIALAVIVFPLLFSKNTSAPAPAQVVSVNAPPFPDQVSATSPADELALDAPAAPQKSAAAERAQLAAGPLQKPIITHPPAEASPIAANDQDAITALQLNAGDAANDNPIQEKPKKLHTSPQVHTVKSSSVSFSEKDLVKLKNSAWVVQMGSFRDKSNATRLADKLRSAGFKAFTREVKAKNGSQMRVYVGPEFKQLAALKLSSQIARDTNLQGIVMLYKPLAL